jgi:hypothetical protein
LSTIRDREPITNKMIYLVSYLMHSILTPFVVTKTELTVVLYRVIFIGKVNG